MQYERSQRIERRLESVLELIRAGRYSTQQIAEKVGVSIPTASRCVTALRERGFDIRSERHATGWQYVLVNSRKETKLGSAQSTVDFHG